MKIAEKPRCTETQEILLCDLKISALSVHKAELQQPPAEPIGRRL
jgi:hypothetical protein